MYEILNVVYGSAWTEAAEQAYAGAEGLTVDQIDPYNLEDLNFEFFYSGHADFTPGCFGEILDDMAFWETTPERTNPAIPEDVKAKVDKQFEELPEWAKNTLDKPKLIHVWSTS
jgi:hypothetical protein